MDSASVAAALTPVVAHSTAVWCGDYSADRGSGSVPAFLAARLHRQQALGLVGVEFIDPLRVTRRLDGGRREILRITGPAVLSVEGSVARLRRASLRSALTAQKAEVLPYGTPYAADRQHLGRRGAAVPTAGPCAACAGRCHCTRPAPSA